MIENLPSQITSLFVSTTLLTLWFLLKASPVIKPVFLTVTIWLIIQGFLAWTGFYLVYDAMPPRFPFLILLPLILIICLFLTASGKLWIDSLNERWLTYLHVVRIPVEITLFMLYTNGLVPQLMTFEGGNFDIISGITAPFIAHFGYARAKFGRKFLLAWNFICMGLLLNIVINAILAAPTPFQQFAFDQPNVGVLYAPFVWLPCFIVPAVLFSHLAGIRQLLKGRR